MTQYPVELLDEYDDDGTMVQNKAELEAAVVGHRIVNVEKVSRSKGYYSDTVTVITLDNDTQVELVGGGDCCAYTELQHFLLHPEMIDHVITGIGTTGGYTKWHIFADMGDVLDLTVGWSCGNPFYYGYGFEIEVKPCSV